MTSWRRLFKIGMAAMSAVLPCVFAVKALAVDPVSGTSVSVADLYSGSWGSTHGQGIRVGNFLLLSSLHTSATFDDNVFASSAKEEEDWYFRVAPEARLVSQWSRHSLNLAVGGDGDFYGDETGENRGNLHVGANGVLEVQRGFDLIGYAKYRLGKEERGTGDSFLLFDDQVEYGVFEGGAGARKRFNRLWFEVGAAFRSEDYDDAEIDSIEFDQDFRDGTFYEIVSRFGYDLSIKTALYAEAAYNRTDYREDLFDGDGYRVLGGVRYEVNQLISADVAAGFLQHDYDSASVGDVDSFTYRARIFWSPTPLIDVTLIGEQDIGISSFAGSSSRLNSEAGIRVDYAFRRNMRLSGLASYEWIDYETLDREDNVLTLGAGAEYFFNPIWSVSLDVLHRDYDSAIDSADYERNRITLGSRLRY